MSALARLWASARKGGFEFLLSLLVTLVALLVALLCIARRGRLRSAAACRHS